MNELIFVASQCPVRKVFTGVDECEAPLNCGPTPKNQIRTRMWSIPDLESRVASLRGNKAEVYTLLAS